jgi:hypothetical protein
LTASAQFGFQIAGPRGNRRRDWKQLKVREQLSSSVFLARAHTSVDLSQRNRGNRNHPLRVDQCRQQGTPLIPVS